MTNNIRNSNTDSKNLSIKIFTSINDLRDKDYKDLELSPNERLAIKNFDRYRINELNNQPSEDKFHNKYMQLQVMANLTPYDEFLKEAYF